MYFIGVIFVESLGFKTNYFEVLCGSRKHLGAAGESYAIKK